MPSPTVGRRRLGIELRKLREQSNLTMEKVAKETGLSEPTISRVENGKRALKPVELRGIMALYGITDPIQQERLQDMAKVAAEDGWWDRYNDVLPSGLGSYVGLEAEARALRSFTDRIIHGLLQTPDYARAIIKACDHRLSPDVVDQLVEVRIQRQQILHTKRPPLLRAIVDESAVRRPIGGARVMEAQLRHLTGVTQSPDITLQVMPFRQGAHAGLDGSFALIEFADPDVQQHVYVESVAGNIFLQKRQVVAEFRERFDLLQMAALSPQESEALISTIAKEFRE